MAEFEDFFREAQERAYNKIKEMERKAKQRAQQRWNERIPKNAKIMICPLCGEHRLEHLPETWKKHIRKFNAEKRKIAKKRESLTPAELKKLIEEQYNLCPEFFENELNILKIEDFKKTDIFEFDQYSFFRIINQGLFSDPNINRLLIKEYLIRRRMKVASLPSDISRIKLENNLMSEFIAEKGQFLEYLQFAENRMRDLQVDLENDRDLERAILETEARSRQLLGLEGGE